MKLRVARHTKYLQPLIEFYTGIMGLTVLGDFRDHAGYNGVFIGDGSRHWHLEFTVSEEAPDHHADEDDMLVFYPDSVQQYNDILKRANFAKTTLVTAKNPYWKDNAVTLLDPDGFRVVIVMVR